MKDIITGVLCIGFSLIFWGIATSFPHSPKIYNSPAIYPQSLAVLLCILAAILIFSGIRQAKLAPPKFQVANDLAKPMLIGATLIGYLILLLKVKFVFATFIFLLLVFRLFGGSWKEGLVFSALLTVGEYLVFGSLLKVPLP